MKIVLIILLQIFSQGSFAVEPNEKAVENPTANPSPVLANTEGDVRLLVPVAKIDQLKKNEFKKIKGKLYQVIPGVPGMAIPNGATIQTLGEAKAQVILENGNSFVAGKATEMVMSWAKDIKGKTAFDVNVKDGLVRGIVKAKENFSVNVLTNSFKAKLDNADFITGKIDGQSAKDAAKGAVLKMLHGDSKLMPLTKLANMSKDMNAKEVIAKAGTDIVMGLKDVKAIPMLESNILKQATSISSKFNDLKNSSGDDFLKKLVASADSLSQEIGSQPAPEPDNCGCPSLQERIKRAALKKARAQLHDTPKKPDVNDPEKKDVAETPAGEKESTPEDKGILSEVDPMTELSCMSPVLTQLKGAAQIVNMLKDGIFSSKEAKPGDCVSNNSLFKNLTNSRSQLKFPNGDEIFSSDNTDVLMKWTKKKLDLKVDQGSIRGVFEKSTQRAVDLQSGALKATTSGGDLNLSAPKPSIPGLSAASAQLAVAGAAAPLAANLASGLLGSALSVFGGIASVAGQVIPAGSQIGAGQTKPQKMTAEQMAQLEAQTAVPPGAAVAPSMSNIPMTPPPSAVAALAAANALAPSATALGASTPTGAVPGAVPPPPTTNAKAQDAALGAAAAAAMSGTKEAAGVVGAIGAAAGAVASGVGTAAGAVSTAAVAGAATPAVGNLPKLNPLSDSANQGAEALKASSEALQKAQANEAKSAKNKLWDTTEEDPEEAFVKKYLKWDDSP